MPEIQATPMLVPNGGIEESLSDSEIDDKKWSEALDIEPMPDGFRRRRGIQKVNATVLPGADNVRGLLDYRLSDGVTARILVASGAEVYKDVSGTMTQVSTTSLTDQAHDLTSMVVAQDRAYISDGVLPGKKFYVLGVTEYWENDGIAPPTATPVLAAAAGGSLAAGTWYVDYYYWNNDLAIKSNTRWQGLASTDNDVVLAGANLTISITGLPAAVVRAGDRATHIRISLKSPSGAIFLFAGTAQGQITLGTTTGAISTDALFGEPDYDDDVAPIYSCSAAGANQRFIAGVPGLPWRVYASKITGQSPYVESFPALRYRDFGRGEGDYVVGLAFMPPATLIVGMKNSVWAIDARRFASADPILIGKGVGFASKKAFQVLGSLLFFVSDSDTLKGMMLWDGEQVKPLTSLDKTFKGLDPSRLKYCSCAQLSPGDNRFQWWTLVTATGSGTHNRCLVYDWSLDAWTIYRIGGAVLGQIGLPGAISKIRVGGTAGFVYLTDAATTDDGAAVVGEVSLKNFDFGSPDKEKRARWVRYQHKQVAAGPISFLAQTEEWPNFSATLPVGPSSAVALWGTAVWGSFTWAAQSDRTSLKTRLTGKFRSMRPKFSARIPFHITGLAFGVQFYGES